MVQCEKRKLPPQVGVLQFRAVCATLLLAAVLIVRKGLGSRRHHGACGLVMLQLQCVRLHALKGLALPQAWSAVDVRPTWRSRRSDSRATAPVLSRALFGQQAA